IVSPEPEHVRFALRGRVDPASLITRKRALLVVGGDDVLTQLRAKRLERVAKVPEDREVTQDRAPTLQEVITHDTHERGGGGARARAIEYGHGPCDSLAAWADIAIDRYPWSSSVGLVREVLPGVFHWPAIHPRIHIEVSSYWLQDGGIL